MSMSMNLSRLTVIALSVAAVSLTGCSSNSKTTGKSASSPQRTTSKSTMTTMAAPRHSASDDIASAIRGQTFSVQLPTSNGSEHCWRLAPASAEDKYVRLQDLKQQQNTSNDMPGAPAKDVFTFRANRTGRTTLTFYYDRAMGNEAPSRTFTLDVDVYKNAQELAQANAESSMDR